MAAEFRAQVLAVVRRLRPGEVVSYGDVAAEAGYPGAARAVGAVLARAEEDLPWWRVVTATGRLVPGHEAEHARRLRAEGVTVDAGRVAVRGGARTPGAGSRRPVDGPGGGAVRGGRRPSFTLPPMDPLFPPPARSHGR